MPQRCAIEVEVQHCQNRANKAQDQTPSMLLRADTDLLTACLPSQRRWPLSAFVVTDSAFLPYWGGGLVRAADDSNVRSRQALCVASANSSPDQARAGAG
jgi:hypothetical protein